METTRFSQQIGHADRMALTTVENEAGSDSHRLGTLHCYAREFCIFNKFFEQEKTETTESRFELPTLCFLCGLLFNRMFGGGWPRRVFVFQVRILIDRPHYTSNTSCNNTTSLFQFCPVGL
jgi:hypothetical protein